MSCHRRSRSTSAVSSSAIRWTWRLRFAPKCYSKRCWLGMHERLCVQLVLFNNTVYIRTCVGPHMGFRWATGGWVRMGSCRWFELQMLLHLKVDRRWRGLLQQLDKYVRIATHGSGDSDDGKTATQRGLVHTHSSCEHGTLKTTSLHDMLNMTL